MSNGPVAAEQLRLLIERIERLEAEKKAIADDIRGVYAEAKSNGFDTKTMRAIVKLRSIDEAERREQEALLDTYKAALGMLDGTPLGHWALQRLSKADPKPEEGEGGAGGEPDAGTVEPPAEEAPPEPETTPEQARAMGAAAAREGKPVTANPFPARDVGRAAWDEAWCQELGTDGMDIPDALKPTPKPKKGAPGAGGEGGND
ncbi:hypothetical protein NX02_04330 [Sphingomonas sanxanigenens DSM 19645 = NX02]|uniref:UPF0335 protein NX02_04330 n=1 Tax=Sphingomonas sanxanigenens DSM 19645 = NX02 TaxID=1123269 RepID=W0A3T9_9SPHN|nr:hypothetical protein NX02_04330 [Sphingomonas sanxanigenens DSM 19645 = NX02]